MPSISSQVEEDGLKTFTTHNIITFFYLVLRKSGHQWNIPYSLSTPRDDIDRGKWKLNLTSVKWNDKLTVNYCSSFAKNNNLWPWTNTFEAGKKGSVLRSCLSVCFNYSKIFKEKKLPFLVNGNNYYCFSVL